MKKQNLLGNVYNRYTVIALAPSRNNRTSYWLCQCSCGNVREVAAPNLKSGSSGSCGCFRQEIAKEMIKDRFVTHGEHKTRLYTIYNGMRKRCYTINTSTYKNYGAIGIKVSPLWATYELFKLWATTNGYTDELSLDRIDNIKDYSPDNCRWATRETQSRNRRKTEKPTSSKFIGVSWSKSNKKWISNIGINSVCHIIGYFTEELEAAKARDKYITINKLKYFQMNF